MRRRQFLVLSAALTGSPLLRGAGGLALGAMWPGASSADGAGPSLPTNSDVIFTTRSVRPNAVAAFRQFGATRSEWTYDNTPGYVKDLSQYTSHVGLSLNANLSTPNNTGAALGLDGKPFSAPWMNWGATWISSQRAGAREAIFTQADNFVRFGASSVQFDDPGLEYEALPWAGGDWSPEAIANFAKYVSTHGGQNDEIKAFIASGADMLSWVRTRFSAQQWTQDLRQQLSKHPLWGVWEEFQLESVLDLHRQLKDRLARNGRGALLSFNLSNLTPSLDNLAFTAVPDYIVGEIYPPASPAQTAICVGTTRMFKKPFVGTPVLTNDARLRESVALLYALGENSLIPWDTYLPAQSPAVKVSSAMNPAIQGGRYYGRPETFADIYKFVREHGDQLRSEKPVVEVALLLSSYKGSTTPPYLTAALAECLSVGVLPAFVVEAPDGKLYGVEQFEGRPPLLLVDIRSAGATDQHSFGAAKVLRVDPKQFSANLLTGVTRLEERLPKGWVGVIRASTGSLFVHFVRNSDDGGGSQVPANLAVRVAGGRLNNCSALAIQGTLSVLGQESTVLGQGAISGDCSRLALHLPGTLSATWCMLALTSK